MKIFRLLSLTAIPVILTLSCNTKTKNSNSTDSLHAASQTVKNNLKSLEDLKMNLMDANLDKVTDLFGQPDDKGENGYASLGHYIYYDKVDDGGKVKNLVIFWSQNRNIANSYPTIKKVEAVNSGGHVSYGTYGNILVQKPNGNDRSKSNKKFKNQSSIIRSLTDLPIPAEAVKSDGIKKYTVKGVSAREVYLWYANNYHATLQSNAPSDHKYLYIPLNANDNCILLTMTGSYDGSIILEFSSRCDSNISM